MNEMPTYPTRFVPLWMLEHTAFQALVEHYMECDEKVLKYHVEPWYEGMFTVLNTHDDDFVYVNRGRTKTKKIWKTRVFDEALRYAMEMNRVEPPRVYDETSLSQRIVHINANLKKVNTKKPVVFKRCTCGTMYRGDKHCK